MINGQRYVIFFFIDTTYIDLNRDKARLEFRKKCLAWSFYCLETWPNWKLLVTLFMSVLA